MNQHNNFIYRRKTPEDAYRRAAEPFLKDVVVYNDGKYIKSGKARCYVYGKITIDQFVSTYYLYGVGFATNMADAAFARPLENKYTNGIGVIEIEFLQRQDA